MLPSWDVIAIHSIRARECGGEKVKKGREREEDGKRKRENGEREKKRVGVRKKKIYIWDRIRNK